MIEPILESFLHVCCISIMLYPWLPSRLRTIQIQRKHLTSANFLQIFLDFYSMACYSESDLYVSLFYIQRFSPSKVTIHFIFNLCRILCMFQL